MGLLSFQVNVLCEEGLSFSPLGETGEGLNCASEESLLLEFKTLRSEWRGDDKTGLWVKHSPVFDLSKEL